MRVQDQQPIHLIERFAPGNVLCCSDVPNQAASSVLAHVSCVKCLRIIASITEASKWPRPVEFRCSCGMLTRMCPGELHDCAVERAVALEKRKVEALERIANALEKR